ncbi:recombinase family protein [Ructibacterium gallinarum]|uniref:Recombinase family protein n=1 Tax=Ructibacterium gallinarum TaxID=2779355 RepID=A0A9D5M009_9FIRM|nr:recombinase family protein [Ructibacterium gallinarum]MBE5039651.1 recombinase family protein [Ructibacterium gallinarum]
MPKYYAAAYCRISREDGDKTERDSLKNQRELILHYVTKQNNIHLADFYSDDNFSGTNFNRPEFIRMYQDIVNGKINCVIVKDLSRFGRDYIDVGNYLQKIFPAFGVRFIAINDNVDSLTGQYSMITPIQNIFNEQYARDISGKIISTFRNKQELGMFMGAFPSYGYQKDPNNKYKLIIDPYPASIVKKIFKLFCEGCGKIKIADILNHEGILCPSEYKKAIGENYTNSHKLGKTTYWTYSTINTVLKNEIYIGNMVQHKNNCSKFHYGSALVEPEKWIRVENTHEPIIDRETWILTQDLLKRRARQLPLNQNVSLFAGFLSCGDCGRAMTKTKWGSKIWYTCGTHKRYKGVCTPHSISENVLVDIILQDINYILQSKTIYQKCIKEELAKAEAKKICNYHIENQLSNLEIQLNKIKHFKKVSYENYCQGILSKTDFLDYKSDYEQQEEKLKKLILEMQQQCTKNVKTAEPPFIHQFNQHLEILQLDRLILGAFYEKIHIYEGKKIKLQYKFRDLPN